MRVTSIKRKRVTPSIAIHYMSRVLLFVPAVYQCYPPLLVGDDYPSASTVAITQFLGRLLLAQITQAGQLMA